MSISGGPTCANCGVNDGHSKECLAGIQYNIIHSLPYQEGQTMTKRPDQAEVLREKHGYELQPDPEMAGYYKVKGLVIRTDKYGAHWIPEPQARLIAAGPKMLAALKAIKNQCKGCRNDWPLDGPFHKVPGRNYFMTCCGSPIARAVIAEVEKK